MNKLYRKYSNKRVNAKKEGIDFLLSFDEFMLLAQNAGITEEQMTITGYHLARLNDTGPYSINNCRFLPYIENYRERKISEKSIEAARRNIVFANQSKTKETFRRAAQTRKATIAALSKEARATVLGQLSDAEVKRRHEIIKRVPVKFGRLSVLAKLLNLKPQVIGRFLKKYPI